jgi:hypothetical protein
MREGLRQGEVPRKIIAIPYEHEKISILCLSDMGGFNSNGLPLISRMDFPRCPSNFPQRQIETNRTMITVKLCFFKYDIIALYTK